MEEPLSKAPDVHRSVKGREEEHAEGDEEGEDYSMNSGNKI